MRPEHCVALQFGALRPSSLRYVLLPRLCCDRRSWRECTRVDVCVVEVVSRVDIDCTSALNQGQDPGIDPSARPEGRSDRSQPKGHPT